MANRNRRQQAATPSAILPATDQGTATLLIGPPGAGKTECLATLVQAGLKLGAIFTEPNGPDSLISGLERLRLPLDNVHWRYISPAVPSWDTMISNAETINRYTFEALSQIKAGLKTQEYGQFIELLACLADFTCDRTGESFGPVDELGNDWAIALDSLSGLNIMAKDLMVGAKPTAAPGEWGVAMDNEERLIQKLCSDTNCFFVLTAHLERETNELTGTTQLMAGALGRKLAPKIPRFFSDVVHVHREGTQFYWSTASTNVDLKFRHLPNGDKLKPSFVPIVESWKRRNALATKSASSAPAKPAAATNQA